MAVRISQSAVPFVPRKVALDRRKEISHVGGSICCVIKDKQVINEKNNVSETYKTPESVSENSNCKVFRNSLNSCEVCYTRTNRYICIHCKRVFPNHLQLRVHIQEVHKECAEASEKTKAVIHDYSVDVSARHRVSSEALNEYLIRNHEQSQDLVPLCDESEDQEEMDVSCPTRAVRDSRVKYVPKVPLNICFGHGSVKVFKKNGSCGTLQSNEDLESKDIFLTELLDALS